MNSVLNFIEREANNEPINIDFVSGITNCYLELDN